MAVLTSEWAQEASTNYVTKFQGTFLSQNMTLCMKMTNMAHWPRIFDRGNKYFDPCICLKFGPQLLCQSHQLQSPVRLFCNDCRNVSGDGIRLFRVHQMSSVYANTVRGRDLIGAANPLTWKTLFFATANGARDERRVQATKARFDQGGAPLGKK